MSSKSSRLSQPSESSALHSSGTFTVEGLCFLLVRGTEAVINFLRYRAYKQKLRQQRISAVRDWLEVLLYVFCAVLLINQYLFQLFVIPSGSMIPTLLIQDRVVVSKPAFGLEPYPFAPKLFSEKKVERGTVVPFVSPEYRRPSTLFVIAQRIVFFLTFAKVDLDVQAYRNKPGPPVRLASQPMLYTLGSDPYYRYAFRDYQPPLLVKRVVAVGGDRVRFVEGNPEIRPAGAGAFIREEVLKEQLGLKYETNRDMAVFNRPTFYAMDRNYERRVRNSYLSNPHDVSIRSRFVAGRLGDAIPPGYFEPFGDNRDHSHDGRWFGILSRDDLQGRVSYIVAPFRRFRSLDPKLRVSP
ncbi:signal peptidase I [Candidatus Haliotispira prima]|uniref:Signal peptidase I n=1 Tax=Candidatus Haliotispira prima TaxID=3034016 RepID=A0ABY8MF83_9SPIO|nr:signal peptidase I [Candidatus Haliotispira prima]